jgi:hypothetical protein
MIIDMDVTSENVSRADDQQERLAEFIGWIVGFVDGEGCFSINFIRQPDRQESARLRKGYRSGYQIAHEFAVTQGESSKSSLEEIQRFFGVGSVIVNTRYDNHTEHLYRFVVRKRQDLLRVIIPFFERHELRTVKGENFKKFAQCVRAMEQKEHLQAKGFISIATVASTMNRKRNGEVLARILRDHTSNASQEDEEMVRTPWRHGEIGRNVLSPLP